MYDIKNRTQAIKEVQRLLGITENGIYDSKTERAVREFRHSIGLEPTTTVDSLAFYALVKESKSRLLCTYLVTIKDFPYDVGDFGDEVEMIGICAEKILSYHDRSGWHSRGKLYTESMGRAIGNVRSIFGEANGTHTDERLYARMMREILMRERLGKA